MTQLILGCAYGYGGEDLRPFAHSLRKYYQGDVVFVVADVDPELEKFCEDYGIIAYTLEEPLTTPSDVQTLRYRIYRDIITEHFESADHILITDVRDVIFQADPFGEELIAPIQFFIEPELFKNCSANAPWIQGLYGKQGFDLVADEYVLCSGTSMGSRQGMLDYCTAMDDEVLRFAEIGRPVRGGEDQPIHNYLVYSRVFPNYVSFHNGRGAISTMHHQKEFRVSREGCLLNDNGKPTPVIHQWDRTGAFADVFRKVALSD
jgi:hypothetical protein